MVDVCFLGHLNNTVHFKGMDYFTLTSYLIGYDICEDCYSRCTNCEYNDRTNWWDKVM